MTYKRFTSFIEDDGYWIRDESDFKIIATGLKFGVAENLIAMLNGLTAKNKVLHKEIERLKTQNKDLLYSNAKNMELLEKENEQLKQYIYDNLDEDICNVCSYQYLEKSKIDKYYVAKCKKGYDNCSKGTVIHCEDFKFKELQE
jgi:FtsZ-binding cell division protein ZapB